MKLEGFITDVFHKVRLLLVRGMFPTMKNDVNSYLWAVAKNLWNTPKRKILFYCPALASLMFQGLRQHRSLHNSGGERAEQMCRHCKRGRKLTKR